MMGKHRTQKQKLLGLRQRLDAGETIKSREMRAALGADDYTAIYKEALAARKKGRDDYDSYMTERTDAQKEVAQAIRTWRSITSRVAKGTAKQASADKWEEKLCDLFAALTHEERARMNNWTVNEVGAIVFNDDATTKGLSIYRGYPSMGDLESLKREAQAAAIEKVLKRR